ncbi:MAG: zinc ribbon domain-containing protein [Gemmatimonadaceae bacterium]
MIALAVGTLLALAALAFVLYPLFSDPRAARAVEPGVSAEVERGQAAIAALREVEFDRATGKLSDSDYAALSATYTSDALAAMRAEGAPPAADAEDPVEAVILQYRARRRECTSCGPRPEADALYCSSCGRYLPGACAACGTAVAETGAQFCRSCGAGLAA